jgi:hypothetical protein
MQLDPQVGDDAEVAAAAAYCPEELGLLIGTGRHAPPVPAHYFGTKQVVRCQAVPTVKRSIAAAQSQAGHADRTAVAQRRNQTMGTSGGGQVLDRCPTGDSCDS